MYHWIIDDLLAGAGAAGAAGAGQMPNMMSGDQGSEISISSVLMRKSTRNGMFDTKISHDTRILNGNMSVFVGMQKKTSAIIQKMDC